MTEYKLTHLRDDDVVRNLAALVTRDRTSTAMLLAFVAELDARKLHVPAGYPSMFAYCTEELHMSEDVACKRIAAARAARKFPVLSRHCGGPAPCVRGDRSGASFHHRER